MKKNPFLYFSLFAFVSILAFCILSDRLPKISGEVELLFPKHSKTLDWQNQKNNIFGNAYTDTIALDLKNQNVQDNSLIAKLDKLEIALLDLDGVESIIMPPLGAPPNLDLFGLISNDNESVRLIVKIDGTLEEQHRVTVNENIKAVLLEFTQFNPKRAGTFVTTQEVAKAVASESQRVTPWVITILAITLITLFRDLRIGLFILGLDLLSMATVVLAYSALGFALGPVTQLAMPFLIAIGASFNVHVVSRYLQSPVNHRRETLSELRMGITLASFTTAGSLLSLYFLDVSGVTRFAVLASSGVILSAVYALTIAPAFLRDLEVTFSSNNEKESKLLRKIGTLQIVWFTIALSMGLALGIGRLEIHTDPLNFLPNRSPVLEDIASVNEIFPGNHFLSLLFLGKEGATPLEFPSIFGAVKRDLDELSGVQRVVSPYEVGEFSKSEEAMGNSNMATQSKPVAMDDLLSEDGRNVRLIVETKDEGNALLELSKRVHSVLKQHSLALESFDFGITSHELIMAEQTTHIAQGLIKSLATTLFAVFILLLLIFKRLSIALIGLVPNILPLLGVFGLLGFFSNELNFGTCLVATSALGIAVDNTFHFLLCWRSECKRNRNSGSAIKEVLRKTVRPFCITSIALVTSFAAMFAAESQPVSQFGTFLCATLILGLYADLVVLPHLLSSRFVKHA